MRTGHYLTLPKAGHQPSCWVSVVVEPQLACGLPENSAGVPSKFGRVRASWTRRVGPKWSAVESGVWDSPAPFWMWLERYAYPKRRTWVVCPVASDVLTYLLFWDRCDRLGARFRGQIQVRGADEQMCRRNPAFTFRRLVMRGKPDIIDYSLHERQYTWLSIGQFWPFDLSRPTTPQSPPSSSSPCPTASDSPSTLTATEKSRAIIRTMVQLGGWWNGLKAGSFGATIGACAYSFLRSRMTPRSLCTHGDTRALKLERLACHGGRASAWFYGDCVAKDHAQSPDLPPLPKDCPWHLEGTLYHVDVSSMYPWLMSQIEMPTKLVSVCPPYSPADLLDLLHRYCVVAQVMLDTPAAEYPHRRGERVLYPTGKFRAVLCGAELRRALTDGVVTDVLMCVVYEKGRPFAAAAHELLAMRTDARARGDEGWEVFTKLLANSVTGKLAQRSATWVDRPKKYAEKDWGEWRSLCPLTGAPQHYRAISGMVQQLVRDQLCVGTRTACYAHITAAGRTMMRGIREALPTRSVVSQDTDGLWVTAGALRQLEARGTFESQGPGRLRTVAASTSSRWYSPKHYYAAGEWTLAGMHHPVGRASSLSFFDTWTSNLARSSSPRPPDSVTLHTREVTLALQLADGTVGDDGWQIPHHIGPRVEFREDPVVLPEPPRQLELFGGR